MVPTGCLARTLTRRVSASLEDMIENRKPYTYTGAEKKLQPVEGVEHLNRGVEDFMNSPNAGKMSFMIED